MDGHYDYGSIPPSHNYIIGGDPNLPPTMYEQQYAQPNAFLPTEALQNSSASAPSTLANTPEAASRSKRKQHGPDHVKHRRTRSGCYTCRSRRVKCDEIRPQCDRCRKGKRECVYPDPNQTKQLREGSKSQSHSAASETESSEDDAKPKPQEKLATISDDIDEEKPDCHTRDPTPLKGQGPDASSSSAQGTPRKTSDSSSRLKRPLNPRKGSRQHAGPAQLTDVKSLNLPQDVQFYIRYHRDNITYNHYCHKFDESNFLKTTFLEIAYSYEPLLYAVTAFSAYFHTLQRPDAKLTMFLQYYNKSLSLLRKSLESSSQHTVATLLTILQLASFEEILGDWENVMAHQKGACEIITELFTPANIMQNETRRKILRWYFRFDIMTATVSGAVTRLGRDWHEVFTDYYVKQAAENPDDLPCIIQEKFAKSGLMADDFTLLFGKKARGMITDDAYASELAVLTRRVEAHEKDLMGAFADTREYVQHFPNAPADRSDDIPNVNATATDYLWADPLWTWNHILIDWWGMKLMYLGRILQFDQAGTSNVNRAHILEHSRRICRIFEGMIWANKENISSVLGSQSNFALAVTALPKDERHKNWCRKHLAFVERCGNVYPASFRTRMAVLWNDPEVEEGWLPNDEGRLPITRQIQDFVSERARIPLDEQSGSVRDLTALFTAMNVKKEHQHHGWGRAGGVAAGAGGAAGESSTAANNLIGEDASPWRRGFEDRGFEERGFTAGAPAAGAGALDPDVAFEDVDWTVGDFDAGGAPHDA